MLETLRKITWKECQRCLVSLGFLIWILLVRFLTLMVSASVVQQTQEALDPCSRNIYLRMFVSVGWLQILDGSKSLDFSRVKRRVFHHFHPWKIQIAWHFFCLVLIPFVQKMWQQDSTSHSAIRGLRLGEVPKLTLRSLGSLVGFVYLGGNPKIGVGVPQNGWFIYNGTPFFKMGWFVFFFPYLCWKHPIFWEPPFSYLSFFVRFKQRR